MDAFGAPLREHMSAPVRAVDVDMHLPEVARILSETGFSGLPVLGPGSRPLGVVTRSDLLNAGTVREVTGTDRGSLVLPDRRVGDVMLTRPLCVSEGEPLSHAVRLMRDERVHRVLVVMSERLVGIVTTWDVIRALAASQTEQSLERFMTAPVVKVAPTLGTGEALLKLRGSHVHALVVVEHGWPIGVFGQAQALAAERADEPSTVERWLDPALLVLPATLSAHRAAAQAIATGARTIVVVERGRIRGIVTGTNFLYAVPVEGPGGTAPRPPRVARPVSRRSRETVPAMPAARRGRGEPA